MHCHSSQVDQPVSGLIDDLFNESIEQYLHDDSFEQYLHNNSFEHYLRNNSFEQYLRNNSFEQYLQNNVLTDAHIFWRKIYIYVYFNEK